MRGARFEMWDPGRTVAYLASRFSHRGLRPLALNPMKRLLGEPLVHFLLLGALLFAVDGYSPPARGLGPSSKQIQLSLDDLAQLALQFQAQWRREPTPEELTRLIENKVQNEVLYREALAMGLDKDDEIVKRRMAQKIQFLAEDVAAAREPTTAELKSWYEKNSCVRTAQPGELPPSLLLTRPPRQRARDDAAKALAKLAGQPQDAKVAGSLADPFMFQDYYRDRAPEYFGKEFGPQFALAVAKLATGSWQGPMESGLGWHLVFVDTVISGRVPAFEEVERDVKSAWLGEQKELAWRKAYEEMRAKYTVLLPAPPDSAPAKQVPGNGARR